MGSLMLGGAILVAAFLLFTAAAGRRGAFPHRQGDRVLPARSPAAAAGGPGDHHTIAQEQQIETERHRVEVARLQVEQQPLLNQTLTAEALTKQYLEVLHDIRTSNNGC